MKFELEVTEPLPDAGTEEIARILLARFGLLPRKKDGQAKMHSLLLELYERKKVANREKKPEEAVMTVEDMGVFAGIKRQTMYDYLGRWLSLNLLKKTSFVANGKIVIGYELNGTNLESAFKKAESTVKNHLEQSIEIVRSLQSEVKREKIRQNIPAPETGGEPEPPEPEPPEPEPQPEPPAPEPEPTPEPGKPMEEGKKK
jgi:DNA primase catalytic subunit